MSKPVLVPYPVVLASASPRRVELLKSLIPEFVVDPADLDEEALVDADPWVTAQRLAREKAFAVFDRHPESLILAGDTVVAVPLGGESGRHPGPGPLPPSPKKASERNPSDARLGLRPGAAETEAHAEEASLSPDHDPLEPTLAPLRTLGRSPVGGSPSGDLPSGRGRGSGQGPQEFLQLSKPVDEADAARMLGLLQGRSHKVITGVAIRWPAGFEAFTETATVHFRPLTPAQIEEYVATGEPMDKAGAYGAQGMAGLLIDRIEGDFETVVGFPVRAIAEALRNLTSKK